MNLLLILLLVSPSIQTSSASVLLSIIDIFRLMYFSTAGIFKLIDGVERIESGSQLELGQRKLIKGIDEVSNKINLIIDRLDLNAKETLNKLDDMQIQISYETQLNNFMNRVAEIDTQFKLFKIYVANSSANDSVENFTLLNFAQTAVSHSDNSVYNNFLKLNVSVLGSESDRLIAREGLFDLVIKKLSKSSSICSGSQSPSEFITNILALLELTQIKAFLILTFSWMFLRLNNKGQFIKEENILKSNFLQQIYDQAEILKISLDKVDNSYWKCDPRIHENDKTYTQVTKFLQGFVINEVDINSGGNCWSNCAYYTYTKQYGCYWDLPCDHQPTCNGSIVGCRYHYSDMQICLSENSTRIYDYIKFENDDIFGKETALCKRSTSSSSWWRWLFWHCSSCFCYCDDETNSDRYFNLRPVISNIGNNKVITGLRFVKVNKVIHIQIQEGELIENAEINSNSVEWLPVDSYDINDKSIKVDTDYHKLTWEYRAIDLDDLIVPDNYVVTGIKFRRLGGHLNLEVQGTLFDYNKGKLINPFNSSFWVSSDNTDGDLGLPRTELILNRPDNPTVNSDGQSSIIQSNEYSTADQFINFQHTDDIFDAAQTTVPFIDIQKVAPKPPVPLVGIGIYHKGRKYSGGFIAPKVFTYKNFKNILNFQQHLKNLNTTVQQGF